MKLNLIILMLSCISLLSLNAQRNIEGVTSDERGNPLSKVEVSVKDTEISGVTDNKGYFLLKDVPESALTIEFRHPDMEMASASIGIYDRVDVRMVKLGTETFGELSLEALLNIEVVVASKTAEKASDAPGVISVVTRDELERFGGTTLKDVLERVPGLISFTTDWTNRTTIAVRGNQVKANSSHVLILINGRPIRETQEGGISSEIFETFPVNIIERIEVIKGPGSVLYGSDAFSGVINIITQEADQNSVSVSALKGTGDAYGISGDVKLNFGDLGIVLAGSHLQKDTWNAPFNTYTYDFIDEPPFFVARDTSINIDIVDKGQGLFLGLNYKGFRINSTYNEWETTGISIMQNVKSTKYFTNMGYSQPISDSWSMDFNVTYVNFNLLGEGLTERNGQNITGEWTNFITINDNSKLAVGAAYSNISGTEKLLQVPGSKPTVSEGDLSAITMYAQMDYAILKPLKVIGGLQMNKVGDLDLSFVPRAGLIYYPFDKFSVKALYSEAYRAPSINELYMNFEEGIMGNENLEPEKVQTADLSLNYQGTQGQVGVSFFHSKLTNIIQYLPASDTVFYNLYMNADEITFIGGEIEGKYYINRNLLVTASMLYQSNKYDTTENLVPIANFGAKAGISYTNDLGISVSLFNIYQGELNGAYFQHPLYPDEGPYNLLHLKTNFNMKKLLNLNSLPDFSLFVNIDNLLDKKVNMWNWGGFGYGFIPKIPGRAMYFGLNVTL